MTERMNNPTPVGCTWHAASESSPAKKKNTNTKKLIFCSPH